jgi:hypothetical protein
MSLTATIPPSNPVTGVAGGNVKQITEGRKVMVTEQQESGGFWSGLDDLGGNILTGIGNLAGAVADREADSIRTGTESRIDTTGDPSDQPGGAMPKQNESIMDKYKTPILIGGGVLVAATLFLAFKR